MTGLVSRKWQALMPMMRRRARGLIFLVLVLCVGFWAGHLGSPQASAAPTKTVQAVTPDANPSIALHTREGAASAAVAILQQLFATELMSPTQRHETLATIIGKDNQALADLLDQSSPYLVQPLGLPVNVDNRAAAYYYVAPFGQPRLTTYSDSAARVVVVTTSSAGTREGSYMVDIRATQQVDLAWTGKNWRYVASTTLGNPVVLATAAGMGQVIQAYEGAR